MSRTWDGQRRKNLKITKTKIIFQKKFKEKCKL